MERGSGGPPRGRRAPFARALSLGAALGCAVLLGACGSSSPKQVRYLDTAKVEQAIERSILEQRHLRSSVICPPRVQQTPHKFACVATTISPTKPHREIKTPFLVTVRNDKGRVSYVGMSFKHG